VCLIIAAYPTCSTKQEHLKAFLDIVTQSASEGKEVELRILTAPTWVGLPPTVLLAHAKEVGQTWLCLGSIGDLGKDKWELTSLNVAFRPDDKLRDEFRRWFEYLRQRASLLTEETAIIPHLVVPPGDPEARIMWLKYERLCAVGSREKAAIVHVDPETGEVMTEDGKPQEASQTWDQGITKLDPIAQHLNDVYSQAWLVTVDETTRIKPLAIPVKATLLGQQAERTLGAVKHKQQFALNILDADTAKEFEKCRAVGDIMELLSYLLSKGNRIIPNAARVLLDKELEARNQRGVNSLKETLGGGVKEFIAAKKEGICKNLDQMYQELGQGDAVPQNKVDMVLSEVETRLTAALTSRVTPRAIYNRLSPPDLTSTAPDENWGQALSLLMRAARLLRKSMTDAYLRRGLSGLAFKHAEFENAMNIFNDGILKSDNVRRAECELEALDDIEQSDAPLKDKCHKVWALITGNTTKDITAIP
jgi:hypothetical protein